MIFFCHFKQELAKCPIFRGQTCRQGQECSASWRHLGGCGPRSSPSPPAPVCTAARLPHSGPERHTGSLGCAGFGAGLEFHSLLAELLLQHCCVGAGLQSNTQTVTDSERVPSMEKKKRPNSLNSNMLLRFGHNFIIFTQYYRAKVSSEGYSDNEKYQTYKRVNILQRNTPTSHWSIQVPH